MSKVELTPRATALTATVQKHCTQKGVEFIEYPIDVKPELRDEMIVRANGGWTGPQIFIDDQHVGGCDEMMALEAQSKLNPMLGLA